MMQVVPASARREPCGWASVDSIKGAGTVIEDGIAGFFTRALATGQTLLLSARQIHSSLANRTVITSWEAYDKIIQFEPFRRPGALHSKEACGFPQPGCCPELCLKDPAGFFWGTKPILSLGAYLCSTL